MTYTRWHFVNLKKFRRNNYHNKESCGQYYKMFIRSYIIEAFFWKSIVLHCSNEITPDMTKNNWLWGDALVRGILIICWHLLPSVWVFDLLVHCSGKLYGCTSAFERVRRKYNWIYTLSEVEARVNNAPQFRFFRNRGKMVYILR